jgi:uncharacterized membrane protein
VISAPASLLLLGIAVVAVVIHRFAQIVPGVGIAVPMFVPPLVAAVVALVVAFRGAPRSPTWPAPWAR